MIFNSRHQGACLHRAAVCDKVVWSQRMAISECPD